MREYSPKQTEQTPTPERADTRQFRPVHEFMVALSEAGREAEADALHDLMIQLQAEYIVNEDQDTLERLAKVPTDGLSDKTVAPMLDQAMEKLKASYDAFALGEIEIEKQTLANYGGALSVQIGAEMKVIDDLEVVKTSPFKWSIVVVTEDEQHLSIHKNRLYIDQTKLSDSYQALLHRYQQEHEI